MQSSTAHVLYQYSNCHQKAMLEMTGIGQSCLGLKWTRQ